MATASRATYGAWVTNSQNDRFRAANGSKVNTDGSTIVSVSVGFKKKNDNLGYRQAKLKCLVGGISQNIISTNTHCECGWEFNQNPEAAEVTHVASGLRLDATCNFGGCPWVNSTLHGCIVVLSPLHKMVNLWCQKVWMQCTTVQTWILWAAQRRPHWKLTECKGMCPMIHVAQSVQEASRHSNIVDAEKVLLKRKCKLTLGFWPQEVRWLMMKLMELSKCWFWPSFPRTALVMWLKARRLEPWRTQFCQWLDHFGIASSTSSVVLHTDAERAVSELVGTSSDKYTFLVRRARPQQNQSNGGAENCWTRRSSTQRIPCCVARRDESRRCWCLLHWTWRAWCCDLHCVEPQPFFQSSWSWLFSFGILHTAQAVSTFLCNVWTKCPCRVAQ